MNTICRVKITQTEVNNKLEMLLLLTLKVKKYPNNLTVNMFTIY